MCEQFLLVHGMSWIKRGISGQIAVSKITFWPEIDAGSLVSQYFVCLTEIPVSFHGRLDGIFNKKKFHGDKVEYKMMEVTTLSYESKTLVKKIKNVSKTRTAWIEFLRSVKVYTRLDKSKRQDTGCLKIRPNFNSVYVLSTWQLISLCMMS